MRQKRYKSRLRYPPLPSNPSHGLAKINSVLWGFPGGSDGKDSACCTKVRSLGWEDSPGEGNGNPLQHSCLENSMDRGAWWAAVHGVAESRTRLSEFHFDSAGCRNSQPAFTSNTRRGLGVLVCVLHGCRSDSNTFLHLSRQLRGSRPWGQASALQSH